MSTSPIWRLVIGECQYEENSTLFQGPMRAVIEQNLCRMNADPATPNITKYLFSDRDRNSLVFERLLDYFKHGRLLLDGMGDALSDQFVHAELEFWGVTKSIPSYCATDMRLTCTKDTSRMFKMIPAEGRAKTDAFLDGLFRHMACLESSEAAQLEMRRRKKGASEYRLHLQNKIAHSTLFSERFVSDAEADATNEQIASFVAASSREKWTVGNLHAVVAKFYERAYVEAHTEAAVKTHALESRVLKRAIANLRTTTFGHELMFAHCTRMRLYAIDYCERHGFNASWSHETIDIDEGVVAYLAPHSTYPLHVHAPFPIEMFGNINTLAEPKTVFVLTLILRF